MYMYNSLEVVWYTNGDYLDDRNDTTRESPTSYRNTVQDALVIVSYLRITIALQGRCYHQLHLRKLEPKRVKWQLINSRARIWTHICQVQKSFFLTIYKLWVRNNQFWLKTSIALLELAIISWMTFSKIYFHWWSISLYVNGTSNDHFPGFVREEKAQ